MLVFFFFFKWPVIRENGWSMKLFPKSYKCICITWHESNSLKCSTALGVQQYRRSGGQRESYACFAQQIADVDALHTLKKTPPAYSVFSFWDEGPSEPHASELYLSIRFCERSPSQSSSWWCGAKSFLLSSQGGGLSLTLLGVKSNAAFLSALAVRSGWVGHLPSSPGAQDSLPLHGFYLISFIHLLTTFPSSFIVHEAFSV